MRIEKTSIAAEVSGWLRQSPFMILVDYQGMGVAAFTELRKRLRGVNASCHVVKNSLLRIVAKDLGQPDCSDILSGQTAIVFGDEDICAAAKILKNFAAEFQKPALKGGVLDNAKLSAEQIKALADLPSKDSLRAQLLGLLNTPAGSLVRLLNEPASSLARLLKAYQEKAAA